ncbi:hypothetical protein FRB98_009656, partial [Tulasnella sp. 332]
MQGGDLEWFWKPYVEIATIDATYGWGAFYNNDGFPNAQSAMNIIECFLNFVYVYLGSDAALAPLVGFTVANMTLSKTVLYIFREYYCGWCGVKHNDFQTLVLSWMIPM